MDRESLLTCDDSSCTSTLRLQLLLHELVGDNWSTKLLRMAPDDDLLRLIDRVVLGGGIIPQSVVSCGDMLFQCCCCCCSMGRAVCDEPAAATDVTVVVPVAVFFRSIRCRSVQEGRLVMWPGQDGTVYAI